MSYDLKLYKGDLLLDSTGRAVAVAQTEKLTQDVLKIILTDRGTNLFHPRYGSMLTQSGIGQAFSVPFIIENKVFESVQEAVSYLQALQDQQRLSQRVDPEELILAIEDAAAWVDESDPRQYNVSVLVLTERLTSVETSFTFVLQDISA